MGWFFWTNTFILGWGAFVSFFSFLLGLVTFGGLCSFVIREGAFGGQWSFFFGWGGFSSRWWFVLAGGAFGVASVSLSLDGVVLMACPLSLDGVVLLAGPLSLDGVFLPTIGPLFSTWVTLSIIVYSPSLVQELDKVIKNSLYRPHV